MEVPIVSPYRSHHELVTPSYSSCRVVRVFTTGVQGSVSLLTSIPHGIKKGSVSVIKAIGSGLDWILIQFLRLFSNTKVDFYSRNFKTNLQSFHANLPLLEGRMEDLKDRFLDLSLIGKDLKELNKIHQKITETSSQIEMFLQVLEQNKPFIHHYKQEVYDQLIKLDKGYQELDAQFNAYLSKEASFIAQHYRDVAESAVRTGFSVLPKVFKEQLIEAGNVVKTLLYPYLPKVEKQKFNRLKKYLVEEKSVDEPYPFVNKQNSCYLASALQALLASPHVCKHLLKKPLPPPDDYTPEQKRSRMLILKELRNLIKTKEKLSSSLDKESYFQVLVRFLTGNEKDISLRKFQKLLCSSGIHPELTPETQDAQMDAASVVEALCFANLLPYSLRTEHFMYPRGLEGVVFKSKSDLMRVLQVSLAKSKLKLKDHIAKTWAKREEDDPFKFDLSRAIVTDPKKAAKNPKALTHTSAYLQKKKFIGLPELLVVQIKRFGMRIRGGRKDPVSRKLNGKVKLPSSGIINLSKFSLDPADQCYYRMVSLVIHHGHLHGGHYTSVVRKKEGHYDCDDADRARFRRITQKQFLGHKDPYLIFLERISKKEALAIKKQAKEAKRRKLSL